MKKIIIALLLVVSVMAAAQEKKYNVYGIGFYNLENLFDTCHDEGKNDYEYLANGTNKWNAMKYENKLANMSRVLGEMGTDLLKNIGCAIIGVSEVENARALSDLVAQPSLAARNFQFCHVEGPDRRGVDCGLLYNPRLFEPTDVKLYPYVQKLEKDSNFVTRGFLTVKGKLGGEDIAVIVCHLPSRASTSFYREQGAEQVRLLKDSLIGVQPNLKVIVMGDMNDDPMDPSMAKSLRARKKIADVKEGDMFNPWWNTLADGKGTIKYNGGYNLFDQIILSPQLLNLDGKKDYSTLKYLKHQIFSREYMLQQEGKFKGYPKRTFSGGVWLNGYSDHLPSIVYLVKEQ
ncbi:MAG: endonuclease/exonuclease/phosphatase family protein [Prevotella sp.]